MISSNHDISCLGSTERCEIIYSFFKRLFYKSRALGVSRHNSTVRRNPIRALLMHYFIFLTSREKVSIRPTSCKNLEHTFSLEFALNC